MTRKKRKDKWSWVKEPLDLTTGKWKDNWEQYEKKLKKLVEEEFGKQSKEVWERSVKQPLEHVVSLVLKNHNKEWKKILDEKERKQVERKQEIIYKNLREEIEDREWIKKVEEEIAKNNSSYQKNYNVVSHSRTERQSSVKKSRPPELNLQNIQEIQVEIDSGERSKIIGVSPQQTKKIEEEVEMQNQDEEKSNQVLLDNPLEKQLTLENKIRELEKENTQLRLEKQIGELTNQIAKCNKSIKKNFKLYHKLMEKRISENNDSHGKHCLEENQELELKIAELKKQKSELEKQLVFLQKQEVAKIEVFPKN